MSKSMRFRIFCDFDGTIAQNDVGNLVFTNFGDAEHWWRLVDEWREGRIDGRELWQRQCKVSRMTETQLDEFAATQSIDPAFSAFVTFCSRQAFPVYVLSDGMDAYIRRILAHHGLNDLIVRANHLIIHADGQLEAEFPFYEMSCGSCANCKGSHLRQERQPGETIIYVGDGRSDLCALGEADLVFAKDELLEYCRENDHECAPFKTFADVQAEIERRLRG
jgi:2-hydroxy-3-keto-5-methylthiopentenyl-1-phosphate phosphatase